MSAADPTSARGTPPWFPGWTTCAVALVLYAASAAIATYPAVLGFASSVPSKGDPSLHIWTMRWYKACLLEGRLPFFCPEIQYPVGAPLGFLPPMHFQTLLYLPLSLVISNDILCYNLIWSFSILLTGMGTFLLAWHVLRDRCCAVLAGLLAMLSGPMTSSSHSEIEQITLGWFPLFLIAWFRFVDHPGRGSLAGATVLYLLLAMSSPYYMVFGIFPAGLYAAWRMARAGRRGVWPWLRGRMTWFAAFVGLTLPVLALLFSSQIWAHVHGFSMLRDRAGFDLFATSIWSYLFPTAQPHVLWYVLPDFMQAPGIREKILGSYLGVVTLALLAYAAVHRVRFARAPYFWATFLMLVVLSLGAYLTIGRYQIGLPAHWIRKYLFVFDSLRVPARFSHFAAVCAAVIAAGGLRHLLARLPGRGWRAAVAGVLGLVATADLAVIPYARVLLPPPPACYGILRRANPRATFLDVPYWHVGELAAICTYWQSNHRGRTVIGPTANPNSKHNNLLTFNSPFYAPRLAEPEYLANPDSERFDILQGASFDDYCWIYLHSFGIDYVVLHHRPNSFPELRVRLDRLKERLEHARIYEDEMTTVYATERLRLPTRAVLLCSQGWNGLAFPWRPSGRLMSKAARMVAYNPTSDRPLQLTLEASAFQQARTVRLRSGEEELARWSIRPGWPRTFVSPPFRLPAGLHELTLESDGELQPSIDRNALWGQIPPVSLWVTAIAFESVREAQEDQIAPRLTSARHVPGAARE